MFCSTRSSAFLRSSPARITAAVVPSPASSSWVFATSTSIFAAGCSMSISFRIVTPSFVMTTSPRLSTSILSLPRGPNVERTASATAFAAAMLLNCAPLPRSRRVPSFKTRICVPAGIMEIPPNVRFGAMPMLGLLYKHIVSRPRAQQAPRAPSHNSISIEAVARGVNGLLLQLADAVQSAVRDMAEDPAEVLGSGADGAPSTRIDRVAEEAVLRLLDYEGTKINVLSEEAGFVDRKGDAVLVLDPIDGTHNALRGVPAYSVSLAIGS